MLLIFSNEINDKVQGYILERVDNNYYENYQPITAVTRKYLDTIDAENPLLITPALIDFVGHFHKHMSSRSRATE